MNGHNVVWERETELGRWRRRTQIGGGQLHWPFLNSHCDFIFRALLPWRKVLNRVPTGVTWPPLWMMPNVASALTWLRLQLADHDCYFPWVPVYINFITPTNSCCDSRDLLLLNNLVELSSCLHWPSPDHPSLASIAPGRSSSLHPVSTQSCCI